LLFTSIKGTKKELMKTEQLIVQYLYNNKKVTLQDIGTFTISPEINIPADGEKDTVLPPDAIRFEYNTKATQDDGLVNFIVEQTRKIRPLATSDLESFIILNKQFLNIGKPLIFEGMGTLQKTQQGDYSFTQAVSSHYMHETAPVIVKENYNDNFTWSTPPKEKSQGGGKVAVIGLIAFILIGGGIAAYYFINKNKKEAVSTENIAVADTTAQALPKDTAAIQKTVAVPVRNTADTNSFYVVLRTYNDRAAAEKKLDIWAKLGKNVILTVADSATFKVRMPFKAPLADTLRIKDSLSKFYGEKALIELP
jgi:hypothetical protein